MFTLNLKAPYCQMGAIDNENKYFPHWKIVYEDITSDNACFEYIVQFTNWYKLKSYSLKYYFESVLWFEEYKIDLG